MMGDLFNENLKKLKETIPVVAIRLPFVSENGLELCQTAQGEDNLKYIEDGQDKYIHSPQGAVQEAQTWFQSLNLNGINGVVVYGVGLGYYYDAIKNWLHEDKKRFVVLIEDDIRVFKYLMNTERGKLILDDTQVSMAYLSNDTAELDDWAERMAWKYVGCVVEVSALLSYQRYHEQKFFALRSLIISSTVATMTVYEECLGRFGMEYFVNLYHNLFALNGTVQGGKLFERFQDVPMIICGAGPSLNKNCALLEEYRDRALILAGGSAISVLNRHNIQPHFGAGVDPTTDELKCFTNNSGFELPMFFISRLNHEARALLHGHKLFLPATKGGYSIQRWFDEIFDMVEETPWTGYSVLTFCAQIAVALGCNPIIFVGADLAVTGMQRYAAGVIDKNNLDEKRFSFDKNAWEGAIWTTDIYGEKICTQWKWIIESRWFSSFAKKFPQKTFINSTEGGIGFEGVPNVSLAEVIEKYCGKQHDNNALIHSVLRRIPEYQVDNQRVFDNLVKLRDSLKECYSLCGSIEDAFKLKAFQDIGTNHLQPLNIDFDQPCIDKLQTLDPEDHEYKEALADLDKMRANLEQSLATCSTIIEHLTNMEKNMSSTLATTTPREMLNKLNNEVGYKYLLKDIERILNLRTFRTKAAWQLGGENDSSYDQIASITHIAEADLSQYIILREAARKHIDLLDHIIAEYSSLCEPLTV